MLTLVTSISAAFLATIVLIYICAFLYLQEHKQYLLLWIVSWLFYAAHLGLELIMQLWINANLLLAFNQIFVLFSGYYLLSGAFLFLERKRSKWWRTGLIVGSLWILISVILKLELLWISLPTYTFLSIIFIFIGIIFLNYNPYFYSGKTMVGWSYILWGVHKADYPILRSVEWFAPWGYLLSAIFAFMVAIGTLSLYLYQMRIQWLNSEQRFWRLAENAQDVVYRYRLLPKPGFTYINPAIEKITGYSTHEFYAHPDLIYKVTQPVDHHLIDTMKKPGNLKKLLTLRSRHKDGREIFIEHRVVQIYNEEDNLEYLEGIARDVTRQKLDAERIQRQISQLDALRQIDIAIINFTDVYPLIETTLEIARKELFADACCIFTYNPESNNLSILGNSGLSVEPELKIPILMNDCCISRAALTREIIINNQIQSTQKDSLHFIQIKQIGIQTVFCVPLIAKNQLYGVLELLYKSPMPNDPDWLKFITTLSGQLAIGLSDSSLISNLKESKQRLELSYDTTLEGWANALELRDNETKGHSDRVVNLTLALANKLNIPEAEWIHIRRGARLHDIGKMGIPDNILKKPGTLTNEEWTIMRTHPVLAYNLLKDTPHLKPALDIPYRHHERWDGSGYPDGLKGEEIPLTARIFAVVDAWDALLSDRPYRPAWSEKDTMQYIQENAGILFDPQVVAALTEITYQTNKQKQPL